MAFEGRIHDGAIGSSAERRFIHQQLAPDREQIRLIKLLPCDPWKRPVVKCTLETFDFSAKPRYLALSYTWGHGPQDQKIHINDEAFFVSKNLYSFLAASLSLGGREDTLGRAYVLRRPPCGFQGKGYIWVDQLCIDQSQCPAAKAERDDQVSRMDRVYADADRVYAWLGEGDETVREVLRLTRGIKFRPFSYKNDWDAPAFQNLAYWTRAWVVQEMALARELVFMYGEEAATAEEVELMLKNNVYMRPGGGGSTSRGLIFFDLLRTLQGQINRPGGSDLSTLPETLLMYQDCRLTLDKIYSFQNLWPASARVTVNYDWTELDLFSAVMDKLASTTPNKGFFAAEPFANGLNILPDAFTAELNRLNAQVWKVEQDIIDRKSRRYKTWAPQLNPACREGESPWVKLQLACKDGATALFGGSNKAKYPGLWVGDPWEKLLNGWLALCVCGKSRNMFIEPDCSCGSAEWERKTSARYSWMKVEKTKVIMPLFS